MRVLFFIAFRHLFARKRQSFVSLLGIIIGVAFFLAISSLMRGSQNDFIKRLIDNSPHVTISDTFRAAGVQPAELIYKDSIVGVRNQKPKSETRGIRGYRQTLTWLQSMPGVQASAVQSGQVVLNFAGRDSSLTVSGMEPEEISTITTIAEYMVQGTIDDLIANRGGIIVGAGLLDKQSLDIGDNITLASSNGQVRTFKILGAFRTGRSDYDETQAFIDIKRAQALFDRSNRANRIIIKMDNPHDADALAKKIERRIGYKSVSWQESSEDIRNTLLIRNIIMYSVVSAVLLVASFGIYNIIFTVIMEKQRDISILKSMGFLARDIRRVFLIQGVFLGVSGVILGLPLGCLMMFGLMQVKLKPPGASQIVQMPLDWGWSQFAIAAAFALLSSVLAAYFPARKGARILPIDVLRGAM
jgi:lipoprotein-releasing system permease protein